MVVNHLKKGPQQRQLLIESRQKLGNNAIISVADSNNFWRILDDMNMYDSDLISILMPTYNVAQYIEAAVESILNQTYKNIELVIIDDCSTDGTYDTLKHLAEKDSRIILQRNKTNSKICITLNKALSLAHGRYIGRMDGDDISSPERFEILKKYLDDHPDISLVGSQLISIDEFDNVLSHKKYLRTAKFIRRGNIVSSSVSHIWLARREVYSTLEGYRNIPYAEDYDFLLRGERYYQYANVEEYLYKVRIREGNTGTTNGLRQMKTKRYVQNINHSRVKYSWESYNKAIECTDKELKSFAEAYKHLNEAVKSHGKPFNLIYHVIKGCFGSKYVFNYILEAIWVRILITIEDVKYPRNIK